MNAFCLCIQTRQQTQRADAIIKEKAFRLSAYFFYMSILQINVGNKVQLSQNSNLNIPCSAAAFGIPSFCTWYTLVIILETTNKPRYFDMFLGFLGQAKKIIVPPKRGSSRSWAQLKEVPPGCLSQPTCFEGESMEILTKDFFTASD